MKLTLYNEYIASTVIIDGLVLYHQGISSYGAENASMNFQLFIGKLIVAWWHLMASSGLVNIDSGNGLVQDGMKPLPELMYTSN